MEAVWVATVSIVLGGLFLSLGVKALKAIHELMTTVICWPGL